MELAAFLQDKVSFSRDVSEEVDALFVRKEYNKGHQLLPVNNRSEKLYFIESGLARSYYYKDQKDITYLFFGENKFYLSIHNVFYGTPAPYGLELLEKSVICTVEYAAIAGCIDRSPGLQNFSRMLLVELLKEASDRIHAIQFQSARERYESLLHTHPDILLRAPLGHIASYLGITQQTLSVIRAARSK